MKISPEKELLIEILPINWYGEQHFTSEIDDYTLEQVKIIADRLSEDIDRMMGECFLKSKTSL